MKAVARSFETSRISFHSSRCNVTQHFRLLRTSNISLCFTEVLSMPKYVYKPTRCTKFLWLDIIFFWTLYMFQTILVHLQEQLDKLYIAFGICLYHTSGCCVAVAKQQPDVSACTGICDVQLIKCCSWWWTNDSPKHVEPFNEKIRTIHKNICIENKRFEIIQKLKCLGSNSK